MPAHLDAEAKAEWRRITAELTAAAVLTKVDRRALAGYCELHSRLKQISAELAEVPTLSYTAASGDLKAHPLVSAERQGLQALRLYLVEFGLTPSARTRVKTVAPAEEADPVEEWAAGKVLGFKSGKPKR